MATIKTSDKATPLHYKLVKDSSLVNSCLDARWLNVLERDKSMVTTGLNPSMLTIMQQTWGWPVMMVYFNCDSRTFALFSALLVRHQWVSLPHCDQAGVWYDRNFLSSLGINSCDYNHLYKALVSLAVRSISMRRIKLINVLKFDFTADELVKLSLKIAFKHQKLTSHSWFIRSTLKLHDAPDPFKVIHELTLDPAKSITDQILPGPRYKIRKAIRNGLVIRKGTSSLLADFYSLYRNRIHQLGSFGLPCRFFRNLLSLYKNGTVTIFICYFDGLPIGASILLKFMDYSENMWFATIPGYNKLYPSYLLHYAMMLDSIRHGCSRYSMGRSTAGGGVQRYKNQYGGEEKFLYYSHNTKHNITNPSKPFISSIIKKLPISLTQNLDNVVARWIY